MFLFFRGGPSTPFIREPEPGHPRLCLSRGKGKTNLFAWCLRSSFSRSAKSSCIAPALTVYVGAYVYIIAASRGSIISIDTHPLLQRFTLLMLSPSTQQLILLCSLLSATPQYVGKTHTYKGATTFRMYTHTLYNFTCHNHRASSVCEAHSNFSTMLALSQQQKQLK